MILKALYDYYDQHSSELPQPGKELKEIGFTAVIDRDGNFLRFEDNRETTKSARQFLVKIHEGRTTAIVPNLLYDNINYVFGHAGKDNSNDKKNVARLGAFKSRISQLASNYPEDESLEALMKFYAKDIETIHAEIEADPLWMDIVKSLSKKYATFTFRLEGDPEVMAEKSHLIEGEPVGDNDTGGKTGVCLITGKHGTIVDTTSATMIPGSQATAKLVSFQTASGYFSYGKKQCENAPISVKAEFAYTTALNHLLRSGSRNKFMLGNRTFVFWGSGKSELTKEIEDSFFMLFGGYTDSTPNVDDREPQSERARKVFSTIYSGRKPVTSDDRFYVAGLAPNSARIAVTFWGDITIMELSRNVLKHFEDFDIVDSRKEKKPYAGIYQILSAVTLGGKLSEALPSLPEAIMKSIFYGYRYPISLLQSCVRRITAEQKVGLTRAAIIKAYLNRHDNNDKNKLYKMLDTRNSNQGYLCGRLFAVVDYIQSRANGQNSIRERFTGSACSTPAAVFPSILNLSEHHAANLDNGARIYVEKLKQEIFDKISAAGFPAHLSLQDQGRFWIGFYHQRENFFKPKESKDETNNE